MLHAVIAIDRLLGNVERKALPGQRREITLAPLFALLQIPSIGSQVPPARIVVGRLQLESTFALVILVEESL